MATQEAKLRFESVFGYNNKLMKATDGMRFGVNLGVNREMKTVGIQHNLGSSKVALPHVVEKVARPVEKKKPEIVEYVGESSHQNNLAALAVIAGGVEIMKVSG